VLNNLDVRFGATRDGVEAVVNAYGTRLFETQIPTRARVLEASSGLNLYEHASGNDAQRIFAEFAWEVVERSGLAKPEHAPRSVDD